MVRFVSGVSCIAVWMVLACDDLVAKGPLHVRIDEAIAAKFDGRTAAPRLDDAAFLRRVWLDLAGRIPPAEEARRFIENQSPQKRAEMIDRLLAAPTYAERMENLFHVMLMERLGDSDDWRRFLLASFEQNKPWHQMAREILAAEADEATRGAAFFYKKRLESYGANPVDYAGLTRDVGRLFLGVDLQCAECHDHLFIDDYRQLEYQGLFAVYRNLKIRKADFPAIQEKAMTAKLEFVSVFDFTKRQTGPRIPFGEEVSIPAQTEGKDGEKDAAEPIVLPRVAAELAQTDNELFAKNMANRLWFVMMGRGLVDPLDMFHSGNPASHPELLQLLAQQFVAHDFDIKWLLRELALTETYQRGSLIPAGEPVPPAESYLVANEKRLSAEQLLWSTLQATRNLERLSKPDDDGKPNAELADLKERFHKAFANDAREPEIDFNATVKASLFLLNDDELLGLLKPNSGNLPARLLKTDDADKLTDELFLTVFTRRPTDEERAAVVDYLEKNSDRREVALGHVLWGMLTSMEFCVNH